MQPESTYSAVLHGQTVQVKRFKAQPTPAGLDAAPRQARVLYAIVPEFKDCMEGHADSFLFGDDAADDDFENDADYAAIRELEPIDGRIDWEA